MRTDSRVSLASIQGLEHHHPNMRTPSGHGDRLRRKIRILLLHAKIYRPEAITTMLWSYELKAFIKYLNVLKVDDDGMTPMNKFAGTTK